MTGSYNRRYGLELLDRQIKLSQRNQFTLLLAFLVIDNFNSINDTFAHNEGDKILKEVVGLLKSSLREVDIICRVCGDEFMIIFPDSNQDKVEKIWQRILQDFAVMNERKGSKPKYALQTSHVLIVFNQVRTPHL